MFKITVIIPTCNRAKTLFWCLKTCVEQDYENYEIIVSDNFSKDETYEVVQSFNDSRIRYLKTEKHLNMHENWEFALNHVNDGYVMIIGDDDGLIPYSLKHIANIINQTNALAIRPYPITYYWPFCLPGSNQGSIISYNNSYYTFVNSQKALEVIRSRLIYFPDFSILPGLYHAFVNVEVIKKIKSRDKVFFNSIAPDTYSDVIIAAEIDKYVLAFTNVCINGASKYSIGISYSKPPSDKTGDENKKNFHGENIKFCHKFIETQEYPANFSTGSYIVAEAFLQAGERNSNVPQFSIKELIKRILHIERYSCDDKGYFDSCTKLAQNIATINNISDLFNSLEKAYISNNKIEENEFLKNINFLKYDSANEFINVYTASLYLREHFWNQDCPYFFETIYNHNKVTNNLISDLLANIQTLINKDNILHKNIKTDFDYSFFITNNLPNNKINKDNTGYYILYTEENLSLLKQNDICLINTNIDRLWVNSEYVKEDYILNGIDKDIIKVIKYPIDPDMYKIDKKYDLNINKKYKFLYINKSKKHKGISLIIDLFNELYQINNNICIVIRDLSDNPYNERLALGINDNIIFNNDYISQEELGSFYRQFDCYINPFYDNYDITNMIESLSFGNKIITINHPILDYTTYDNLILVDSNENDKFLANRDNLKEKILNIVSEEKINKSANNIDRIKNDNNISKYIESVLNDISELPSKLIIRENISDIKEDLKHKANNALKEKKYDISEKMFYKLLIYENTNLEYIINMAFSQYMQKKYSESIDTLSDSIENDLINYQICDLLAKSLEASGEKELANLFFNKALDFKHPDSI